MHKSCPWLLSLVLAVAMPSLAAPVNMPALASAAIAKADQREARRLKILEAHTSWRWIVHVSTSKGKKDSKPAAGILLGMQGMGTTGPVRSLAWMAEDGTPRWMVLEHDDEQGKHILQLRDDFKEGDWRDVSERTVIDLVSKATGAKVDIGTLHALVSGAPTASSSRVKFVEDEAGLHPVSARMRQGRISWTGWSAVETGKGEPLALPGAWVLDRRNYRAEFQVVSVEAYEAYELPNRGWPFVDKPASKFSFKEEPPIASDEQLDYEQW